MNKKNKNLIGFVICVVIACAAAGIGLASGLFSSFGDAFRGINVSVADIVSLVVMAALVLAVEKLVIFLLGLFKKGAHRAGTVVTITQSLLRYAAAIVIICWGLSILGVNVATIAASVGIITLIVGFGAESLIEDVITGIFMLFENQYNVGDIVEVGGFRGTISDIGIRTTSITDPGGNIKIINNSNMKNILNRSNRVSRSIADIQIPYETDLEDFEKKIPAMMDAIYALHTDTMKSAPIYLGVQELGESGVTLRFVVDVDESNIYSVQRILNRELFVFFRKEKVEVPFPQLDVHQK